MAKANKNNAEEIIEETPVYEVDYGRHKGGGYLAGFFLIFIGLVFLLNNLGFLPNSIWNEIWKFWPLIIIIIGIQVLFGKSPFARMIVLLLTLFVFAGVLAYLLIYSGLLVLPPLH